MQPINMEERGLVVDCIYLGFMLQMMDQERKKLVNDRHPLLNTFLMVNDAMIYKLHKELVNKKKQLKEVGIRYEEGVNNDFSLQFRIWCRGYETPFGITREHAKSELSVRLGKAVAELNEVMRGK